MPLQGGKDILVADVLRAREAAFKASRETGDLPLFLFGHSMGSFVVRACIACNPKGLTGAVLCGTGNQPRVLSPAWSYAFACDWRLAWGKRIVLACLIR